jgi:hypothetical protein
VQLPGFSIIILWAVQVAPVLLQAIHTAQLFSADLQAILYQAVLVRGVEEKRINCK